VNGQADRARLIHNGALDGLADPPSRISRETKAPIGIKLLYGANQTEIPLFDQIQQCQTAV
jgi:hypothetical protein